MTGVLNPSRDLLLLLYVGVRLYPGGLVPLAASLWNAPKLYGKLDDAAFRKVILLLLLASGLRSSCRGRHFERNHRAAI